MTIPYDAPVVYGWLEPGDIKHFGPDAKLFRFICHGCGRTHTHGWVGGGHRGAHCPSDSNSKYHATGYYIALDEMAKRGK